MCGMCGLFSGMAHWSDPGRFAQNTGVEKPAISLRHVQARLLSAFCGGYGVSVRDWMFSSWVLEDQFGASLVVNTLPDVFEGAAKLSGRRLDPLDDRFIAHVEAAEGLPPWDAR